MKTESGSLNEVVDGLLRRATNPIVGVRGRDERRAVASVAARLTENVRVLLDPTISSDLNSLTEMHLSEDHVDVRVGPVGSLFVSGDDLLAVVEVAPRSVSAAVDTNDSEEFGDRWSEANCLETDNPSHSSFVAEAGDRLGPSASAAVDVSATELRGSVDPAGLLVWGGARSRSLWSEVVDVARETGLCSRGALQRRLSTLRDEQLVRTVPVDRDGPGGRPNRLEPRHDLPGEPPAAVLDALS
jgi:hypothetical protein